jgi:hypothetical protein
MNGSVTLLCGDDEDDDDGSERKALIEKSKLGEVLVLRLL